MIAPKCKVLYPVDFSDRSELAAPYVKMWVDQFGSVLHTLHVVDGSEPLYMIKNRAADLMYFSDEHFGKSIARPTVVSGVITEEIEYFAEREEIDLIMLPRKHHSPLDRLLHDSLTATLLERCAASVWTTEYPNELTTSPVHNILCALHLEHDVTLDAQNQRILQTVQELVSTFQAGLTFLYVTSRDDRDSHKSLSDLRGKAGIEPLVARAQELFGSSVPFLRKSGEVIPTIGNTADQVEADLIVVGRTRHGPMGLEVQDQILKIDHTAHRPVLSVW
jgi:nucleotide-binding universal stress UspA family protein